jgi:DNA mismatch repair protein MSH2
MVEMAIDLDELERPGSHSNYMIRKEHDENLALLADSIGKIRDGLDKEHKRSGSDLGLELDKKLHLERHDRYGYCFRVSKQVLVIMCSSLL